MDIKAREAIKDGTFSFTWIPPRIIPERIPTSIVSITEMINAGIGSIPLSENFIMTVKTNTLPTEHIVPMERSMDPNSKIGVIPAAIIIRGAESLNRFIRFAELRKLGCKIVNTAVRSITTIKQKYFCMFSRRFNFLLVKFFSTVNPPYIIMLTILT
jgi:hypothetical protein